MQEKRTEGLMRKGIEGNEPFDKLRNQKLENLEKSDI
jgi:hypothetical protein